ncbi:MAG: hypothetical protein ACLPY3_24630 [Solirubrobacteraceae bacterium]
MSQSLNRSAGDRPEPDASLTMLSVLLDGSLRGLATYHLLKADLLTIRGLPETPSRPISNRR